MREIPSVWQFLRACAKCADEISRGYQSYMMHSLQKFILLSESDLRTKWKIAVVVREMTDDEGYEGLCILKYPQWKMV